MKNPKFLPVEFAPENRRLTNANYIPDIANLLLANADRLFDTFFDINEQNKITKTIELIRTHAPQFWAIVNPKNLELAGIVYLYDWVGNDRLWFSAKISTCFERKYWGKFAHRAGKLFLRYSFAKFRFVKLCAEVFAQNRYPVSILAKLGFKKEYEKPLATVVNHLPATVCGYSLITSRTGKCSHDKPVR